MPPANESLAGVVVRVESLEEQLGELQSDSREIRDCLSGLRTDMALTRQTVSDLTSKLHDDSVARALPTRAAWLLLVGALVTGALGSWIGRQLPDIHPTGTAHAGT